MGHSPFAHIQRANFTVFPCILPDKQGFDFPPLIAFGSPYAMPDHLKRHLFKVSFLLSFWPGSRRAIPSIFIHCRPRELLEIQQKGPFPGFFSNGEIALIAFSPIQKNDFIILYLSISYQLIFSIAYFIPYLYKNLTFITILYYNIFIDISCRTILFNLSL